MATRKWDILMVDDEAELLQVMGDYLRRHALTVLTAHDGGQALRLLDENEVDVAVLDVNLAAGEDGVDLMSFLKHNYPKTKIIIYTGKSHEAEEVKDMLAKGATCYVNKGPELEELLFAIRQVRG